VEYPGRPPASSKYFPFADDGAGSDQYFSDHEDSGQDSSEHLLQPLNGENNAFSERNIFNSSDFSDSRDSKYLMSESSSVYFEGNNILKPEDGDRVFFEDHV